MRYERGRRRRAELGEVAVRGRCSPSRGRLRRRRREGASAGETLRGCSGTGAARSGRARPSRAASAAAASRCSHSRTRAIRRASTSVTTAPAITCSSPWPGATVRRSPRRRCRPGCCSGARCRASRPARPGSSSSRRARAASTTVSATVPDYNGDGLADVAIGAPARARAPYRCRSGVSFPFPLFDCALTGGDAFGRAIAAVGDLNGDGFVDLAVASGSAGPGWSRSTTVAPAGPSMGVTLLPGPVTSGFGTTMASAGDVNGDGYGDMSSAAARSRRSFFGGADCASTAARARAGGTARRRCADRAGTRATSTVTASPTSPWAVSSTSATAAASRCRPTSRPRRTAPSPAITTATG